MGNFSIGHWAIVAFLGWVVYAALKPGRSGKPMFCSACGTTARARQQTRGSLWIEIILWLCFLVPGLIYSIWRHSSRRMVCAKCGSAAVVPTDTPVARARMAELPEAPRKMPMVLPHLVRFDEAVAYVELTGESYCLPAFEAIFGVRHADGISLECGAELIREPGNAHDPNAVRCEILRRKVGYVNRDEAASISAWLAVMGTKRYPCNATVSGGWDRGGGDTGDFGVTVAVPARALQRGQSLTAAQIPS